MSGETLEAVVLYLDPDGIHQIRPGGEQTIRVAWDPDLHPGEMLVDEAAMLGLSPFMVHSTSWRTEERKIVHTFLVIVEPPLEPILEEELVARAELARGHLMAPPPNVHLSQVVEHGLRHLAWLTHDDSAIREALPDWAEALFEYDREPFRAFGAP